MLPMMRSKSLKEELFTEAEISKMSESQSAVQEMCAQCVENRIEGICMINAGF